MKAKLNISYIILLLIFLASSCITKKKLLIFGEDGGEALIKAEVIPYTLLPGDVLDIRIVGLDAKSVNMFNKKVGGNGNFVSEAAFYLNGYVIDEKSEISLPIVGQLIVKDKTVSEINRELKDSLSNYLNFVNVYVKMVNFRVTILGEVKNSKTISLFNKETNIFQLLGLAGGISDFGDRNHVVVIRKRPGGFKRVDLDLNDPKILESEYFFMKPNDLIYVKPLRAKAFQQNRGTLGLIVSSITLLTLLINLGIKI